MRGELEREMEELSSSGGQELIQGRLTDRILACAIDVHRTLGPGLLEKAYRACLVHRMAEDGLSANVEVPITINYRGITIDSAYRADLVVEDAVLLELKSIESLLPIHDAQVLTYLKFLNLRVGFLINFNVTKLMKGVRRFVR
jgi:GxxExxY protein